MYVCRYECEDEILHSEVSSDKKEVNTYIAKPTLLPPHHKPHLNHYPSGRYPHCQGIGQKPNRSLRGVG
ncbi:hypothetical protein AAMO2058_001129100 [Amorphochlora amoebiformis]